MKRLIDCEWKPFRIEDICEISSGHDIYDRERISGKTPYVTATATNNGIGYFVGNTNETLASNCISVNRNGSVGYAFYHDYEALYGNDTRKLIPFHKNKYSSLFIVRAILQQKDKYGYGYKMGTGRLKRQDIMLPAKADGTPDYDYMEEYMKSKEKELLEKYRNYLNNSILNGGGATG